MPVDLFVLGTENRGCLIEYACVQSIRRENVVTLLRYLPRTIRLESAFHIRCISYDSLTWILKQDSIHRTQQEDLVIDIFCAD